MMHTLDDFLNLLFEGLTGYVYSPLIINREIEQKFFNWPNESVPLKEWIKDSSEKGNVYVSPVIYKEPDAHKKYVKASNVAWVEYDGDSPPNLSGLPEPDCIVQSSSLSHQHIYWRIDNSCSFEQIEEINRRVSRHIGADAGWNINKVLRPPGTKNHKYTNVNTSIIVFSPNGRKPFSAFDEAKDSNTRLAPVEIPKILDYSEILAEYSLSDATVQMVTKDVAVSPGRSGFLYKLGCTLAEEGLKHAEIVTLLLFADERIGKFKGRDDQLFQLSDIATKAWTTLTLKESEKEEETAGLEFLSPDEVIDNEEEITWYVTDWLHSRGGLILSSPPGVGKTQLGLQLAYNLSTGTSFLGIKPVAPLKVLFISLEMEMMELKYIYKKQKEIFKEYTKLWNENFLTLAPDADFGTQGMDNILGRMPIDVIIIDSLSELAGDELKEAEARRVMKWFKKVRRHFNVAIVLIHHNRKAGENNKKPRTLDDLYGSYWFGKSPDTVIQLWHDKDVEHIEVDALKHRFGADTKFNIVRNVETLTFSVMEGQPVDDSKPAEYNPIKPSLGLS